MALPGQAGNGAASEASLVFNLLYYGKWNTILYIYTSQFKSLGFPIIPDLGNGAPVEVQGNKCFSLPFLIYLTSTTTIVKGRIVQMHRKRSSTGFMGKSS